MAEPLAIELLARHRGYDAYVMACYDDIAIAAGRRARKDGAEAIILGSGGLTGRADSLAARHGLPVIDAIAAALVLSEAVARLQVGQRQG